MAVMKVDLMTVQKAGYLEVLKVSKRAGQKAPKMAAYLVEPTAAMKVVLTTMQMVGY